MIRDNEKTRTCQLKLWTLNKYLLADIYTGSIVRWGLVPGILCHNESFSSLLSSESAPQFPCHSAKEQTSVRNAVVGLDWKKIYTKFITLVTWDQFKPKKAKPWEAYSLQNIKINNCHWNDYLPTIVIHKRYNLCSTYFVKKTHTRTPHLQPTV